MKGRELTESRSIRSLMSKRVNIVNRDIYIRESEHGLGNKSWGHVDYLVHYCGYNAYYVDRSDKIVRMIKRNLTVNDKKAAA